VPQSKEAFPKVEQSIYTSSVRRYTESVNRVDRLFAIVLILQQQKLISGQTIAQRFEIGIRTVYRDIAALIDSGVPVVTVPGRGYELMSGYTLPPLAFRPDEAVGVFMGMQLLLAHTTGQTAKHTQQALERLTAAMPSETRAYAQVLTNGIRFLGPQHPFDLEQPHLREVSRSIQKRLVLRLQYQASQASEAIMRDLEPRELSYHQGAWFVRGFCRLRQAERAFRLDRIQSAHALIETFSPRAENTPDPAVMTVEIRVANTDLSRILERQHYRFLKLESDVGQTVLTYQVEQLEEIIPWMLGFGKTVIPLAPPALLEAIRLELDAMIEHLT
jgi:predicted DNA-binding transcriptional regulator YafY